MHFVLLTIHISAMISSLIIMPAAVALALRGTRASVKLATTGIMFTAVGFVSGVVLLLSAPLLAECVILTSYLAAMVAVYALGFAWGNEPKARLLRAKA